MTLKEAAEDLINTTAGLQKAVKTVEFERNEQMIALESLNLALFGHKEELTLDQALHVARGILSATKPRVTPPRTLEAVIKVLTGQPSMNAKEVVTALEEKGWLPASNDPKTYISFLLNQTKTHFERDPDKGRGYYRLVAPTVLQ